MRPHDVTTKQNISLHLKSLFADGELDPAATVKESLAVAAEDSHEVRLRVHGQEPMTKQWKPCHG